MVGSYKGDPTRVGTHTTHNQPSQLFSKSAYTRYYREYYSVKFRDVTARQAIESIRQDE